VLHTEYSQRTVGLVTLDELKKTKEELAKKEVILDELEREKEIKEELRKQAEASKKRKPKVAKASLSFAEDLDGDGDEAAEEEETVVVKKRIVKNPNVNTSFLPGTNAQKYSFIVMLHSK
jgi:protein FAM50